MKKKYITPDVNVVIFETDKAVMDGEDIGGSSVDPWANADNHARVDWWNFPNGTELNEDGTPK